MFKTNKQGEWSRVTEATRQETNKAPLESGNQPSKKALNFDLNSANQPKTHQNKI